MSYPLIPQKEEEVKFPKLNFLIEHYIGYFLTSLVCIEHFENMSFEEKNCLIGISSFLFLENTYSEKILTTNKVNFDFIIKEYQKYNIEDVNNEQLKSIMDNILSNPENIDMLKKVQGNVLNNSPMNKGNVEESYLINLLHPLI